MVVPGADQPLDAALAAALNAPPLPVAALPSLTNVALGDPYLAAQLTALHQQWAIQPPPARGLVARVRQKLAWWLLGDELGQITATHGTVVRLLDSLIVQLDQDRAARRRIEEHLAHEHPQELVD